MVMSFITFIMFCLTFIMPCGERKVLQPVQALFMALYDFGQVLKGYSRHSAGSCRRLRILGSSGCLA
jgi:hypothetical protein